MLQRLTIIHLGSIDLLIPLQNSRPDPLLRLLQIQNNECLLATLLHLPEAIRHGDLFIQVALQQDCIVLFEGDFDVLYFEVDQKVLCHCSGGNGDSYLDVVALLAPFVFLGLAAVVGVDHWGDGFGMGFGLGYCC